MNTCKIKGVIKMSEQSKVEKEVALESVITSAVQIPGVKVSRSKFLDKTLQTKRGVCYDIANLFTAVCRSQNISCYSVARTIINTNILGIGFV